MLVDATGRLRVSGIGGVTTLAVTLTNRAGAATVVGYVYRLDPDNNDSFDYGSENEDAQVVVATSVIADTVAGSVVLAGYTDVYVNGTTVRGQFLYFSATNGQAKPLYERRDGAFAQATAARAGAGLVKAYVFPRERGRQWYAFDEPTWDNVAYLPLIGTAQTGWTRVVGDQAKESILNIGAAGKFDDEAAFWPVVRYYRGTYYMFYNGYDGASIGLGIATSPLPLSGFVKGNSGDAIIPYNRDPVYNVYAFQGAVIIDRVQGKWVWYWFAQNAAGNRHVNVSTCSLANDPTVPANWAHQYNIYQPYALPDGFYGFAVTKMGNRWYGIFKRFADGNLYYCESSTYNAGWANRGLCLTNVYLGINPGSLYYEAGVYYYLYDRYTVALPPDNRILMALATGEGRLYTNVVPVPTLTLPGAGKFDTANSGSASLLRLGTTFIIYYAGSDGTNDRIGAQQQILTSATYP